MRATTALLTALFIVPLVACAKDDDGDTTPTDSGNGDTAEDVHDSGTTDVGETDTGTDDAGDTDSGDDDAGEDTTSDTTPADSGPDTDGSGAFGPWDISAEGWDALMPAEGETATYRIDKCGSGTVDLVATVTPGIEYAGGTWLRIQLGEPGTGDAVVAYVDVETPWRPAFKAVHVFMPSGDGETPDIAYDFVEPMIIPLDLEAGQSYSAEGSGEMRFPGTDAIGTRIVFDMELVGYDVPIEVPFGNLPATTQIDASITATDMGDFVLESSGWFTPEHRVVRLTEIPGYCVVELVRNWQ